MNETKFKISIGALAGSIIIGGAAYTTLNSIKGRTLIPFYRENIKECAVNSRILTIDSANSTQNEIKETNEKKYILEDKLEDINSIEFKFHCPWITNKENKIQKNHYQYVFEDKLSEETIKEKIQLLETGQFNELTKDCTTGTTYQESPIIIPEYEIEENKAKAEMIINSIDYNDIRTERQSATANFEETVILALATIIGGGIGLTIENNVKLANDIRKMDEKSKPKVKTKKYKY